MEQRLMTMLGERDFQIAGLLTQLEQTEERLKALEEKKEKNGK